MKQSSPAQASAADALTSSHCGQIQYPGSAPSSSSSSLISTVMERGAVDGGTTERGGAIESGAKGVMSADASAVVSADACAAVASASAKRRSAA